MNQTSDQSSSNFASLYLKSITELPPSSVAKVWYSEEAQLSITFSSLTNLFSNNPPQLKFAKGRSEVVKLWEENISLVGCRFRIGLCETQNKTNSKETIHIINGSFFIENKAVGMIFELLFQTWILFDATSMGILNQTFYLFSDPTSQLQHLKTEIPSSVPTLSIANLTSEPQTTTKLKIVTPKEENANANNNKSWRHIAAEGVWNLPKVQPPPMEHAPKKKLSSTSAPSITSPEKKYNQNDNSKNMVVVNFITNRDTKLEELVDIVDKHLGSFVRATVVKNDLHTCDFQFHFDKNYASHPKFQEKILGILSVYNNFIRDIKVEPLKSFYKTTK